MWNRQTYLGKCLSALFDSSYSHYILLGTEGLKEIVFVMLRIYPSAMEMIWGNSLRVIVLFW